MTVTALAAAVVAALLLGAAGGAFLVWLLAPKPPALRATPEAPALPAPAAPPTSGLHPVMQQALANAPELFARARQAEEIRKAIACSVCGEGSQLFCPSCDKRVCAAHWQPAAHGCPARQVDRDTETG